MANLEPVDFDHAFFAELEPDVRLLGSRHLATCSIDGRCSLYLACDGFPPVYLSDHNSHFSLFQNARHHARCLAAIANGSHGLQYSTSKPSKPGWYWCVHHGELWRDILKANEPTLVRVDQASMSFGSKELQCSFQTSAGVIGRLLRVIPQGWLWAGPIVAPTVPPSPNKKGSAA